MCRLCFNVSRGIHVSGVSMTHLAYQLFLLTRGDISLAAWSWPWAGHMDTTHIYRCFEFDCLRAHGFLKIVVDWTQGSHGREIYFVISDLKRVHWGRGCFFVWGKWDKFSSFKCTFFNLQRLNGLGHFASVCACVRVCVYVCMYVCVCVCVKVSTSAPTKKTAVLLPTSAH